MELNQTNGKGIKVFDAHSLPHRKASKAAKAADAADVVDGFATIQNFTLRLVAAAFGISVSSLISALRLTPAQRDSVRRGQRPLVLPNTTPQALPAPTSAEQRLVDIVTELGVGRTLDALAAMDVVTVGSTVQQFN